MFQSTLEAGKYIAAQVGVRVLALSISIYKLWYTAQVALIHPCRNTYQSRSIKTNEQHLNSSFDYVWALSCYMQHTQ